MTTLTYGDFLARKAHRVDTCGRDVDPSEIHPSLYGWQSDIVVATMRMGRAANWADTGWGKTRMQLEWARLTGGRVLLVAPLAVCQQTVREAAKLDIPATYVREDAQAPGPGVWVTNYEMVSRFDPTGLDAVVLDESSVIKDVTAKTRDRLISLHARVPRRLACTATPGPNDVVELANHAEYLGAATRREMLATYFVHDADGWRVKGHARDALFAWMAGWAVALRRPSDLGYSDGDFTLPALAVVPELLDVEVPAPDGQLFATDLGGVSGRAAVRRQTLGIRCDRTAALVAAEPDQPWLLWAGLNAEAVRLTELTGAVNVHGAMSPEEKAELLLAFADGEVPYLVTKPTIAGFGMNFQHCARMAFVGLSDSFERYYQCVRRCWRYGQTRPVRVHIVVSRLESQIIDNVQRKQQQASASMDALVDAMQRSNPMGAAV